MRRQYVDFPEETACERVLRERAEAAAATQRAAEDAKDQDVWTLRTLMFHNAMVQFTVDGVTYTGRGADIPTLVREAHAARVAKKQQAAADDAAHRYISWGT